MRFKMTLWAATITAASVTLAGGYVAASALSATAAGEPTKTVTIDVSTGPQGEPGPPGPAGPPGPKGEQGIPGVSGALDDCPAGYTWGAATFIQQGKGPTTLLACIKD